MTKLVCVFAAIMLITQKPMAYTHLLYEAQMKQNKGLGRNSMIFILIGQGNFLSRINLFDVNCWYVNLDMELENPTLNVPLKLIFYV